MANSIFDIFKLGIGPSSSHTVGPMSAAARFLRELEESRGLTDVHSVRAELYGSLALTGRGHATDRAIVLGLAGEKPSEVDPDRIEVLLKTIGETGRLDLLGIREIDFDADRDLIFHRDRCLTGHANGMLFSARNVDGSVIAEEIFYSVGGGFVVHESELGKEDREDDGQLTYTFEDGASLFAHGVALADLVRRNEQCFRSAAEVDTRLDEIWAAMDACLARGMEKEGLLPGGLGVRRRAAKMRGDLGNPYKTIGEDPMDWVNVWAMAVNEENAAGGRVVTAPTNGAAGVLPAVARYYQRFVMGATEKGLRDLLLVAGVIGLLYKRNASISGAEVGCQGEVGVACSMAAAGFAAALGGENSQVENAAEIGMEHHLGLTCDPVGGLVQIPCIERNAMGAVMAINAARLALRGDGSHRVSLDQVIRTMRQTGEDMKSSYRETSLGGLAVNVIEC